MRFPKGTKKLIGSSEESVIKLPSKIYDDGRGRYGRYYRLTKRVGVKVLCEYCSSQEYDEHRERYYKSGHYSDDMPVPPEILFQNNRDMSFELELARDEIELLNQTKYSGVTPKCYGLRRVYFEDTGKTYIGIVLQHLGNVTLKQHFIQNLKPVTTRTCDSIFKVLRAKLKKIGVSYWDFHGSNVMFYRGKYFVIDFTPMFASSVPGKIPNGIWI